MTSELGWKTKYFSALKEKEDLENKAALQVDILKRVLVHLGSVVSGLDDGVDQSVIALRGKLRGASGQAVMDQLLAFERSVSTSLAKRSQESECWVSSFRKLIESLAQLKLAAPEKQALQQFRTDLARLPSESASRYSVYLELLSQLDKLQSQALKSAAQPDVSFWQRIRGGKRLELDQGSANDNDVSAFLPNRHLDGQPVAKSHDDSGSGSGSGGSRELINSNDSLNVDELKSVLLQMAEAISPPDDMATALQLLKRKLAKPIKHRDFADVMREMRDILIGCFNLVDSEFSEYLARVNSALHDIGDSLNIMISDSHLGRQAANSLEKTVNAHMCTLRDSLEGDSDLDALKANVKIQIDTIQSALTQYQAERNESEPLSTQLKTLVEKVQTIEAESKTTRDLLAEERYKATHDPLTKLPNRLAYNDRIVQEWQRFKRYGRPLSISVCDIDHFKSFNDRFGHQTGDKVLCVVAQYLKERVREVDLVARYGGEEFVIIFPETSAENSLAVANQVRKAIAAKAFAAQDQSVEVTLSFGVTSFNEDDTILTAFERADKALYDAKNSGRNRCCLL